MKIKIGNFNFINKEENILNSYTDLNKKMNYFYLDGNEDTLIVESDFYFDQSKYGISIPEYEKLLLEKYKIVPLYKEMTRKINDFISEKVNEMFESNSYSRYDLYKNITFNDIYRLNENMEFKFGYSGNGETIDFDKNRIEYNGFIFNPYTLNVENLEDKLKEKSFNKNIKAMLITKEIEKGIQPPFITEILKINKFLEDKKTANIYFKNFNPFKVGADIDKFLNLEKEHFEVDLRYDDVKNFEKENPNHSYSELKLDDLEKITYSKSELKINTDNFKEIKYQIATKVEDLILFKIDELEKNVSDKFYKYHYKYERENPEKSFPYNINDVLKELVRIEFRNAQVKDDTLNEEMEQYPDYYTDELEKILDENNLINELKQADNLDDLEEIATTLGDKELIGLVENLIENEESEEDEI